MEGESSLQLNDLMKLQSMFGDDGVLDEQSFLDTFARILGPNVSKEQLTYLFMKIDANSDGSIDWDEFTNYMFLHSQASSDARVINDDSCLEFMPSITNVRILFFK